MAKEELRNLALPGSPPFMLDELLRRDQAVKVEGESSVWQRTGFAENRRIRGHCQNRSLIPGRGPCRSLNGEVLSKSGSSRRAPALSSRFCYANVN